MAVRLTRLQPVGDAEMYVLSDDAVYERRFVVSNAQMVTSPDAVNAAILKAVARYRSEAVRET